MSKTVILLTNLGSPDSPKTKDVRKYLRQFLMDGRVIDLPYPLRYILVNGIIAPFRAVSSAKLYKSIWTEEGSPLIVISEQQKEKLSELINMPTYLCMRYANPSAEDTLASMHQEHPDLERIILFPLYPHYAMSSYETGVVHVEEMHAKGKYTSKIDVIKPYYNDINYIKALSDSIAPHLEEEYDLLLMSYHGIPERHVRKTDPSGKHCTKCENCCDVPSVAHNFCYRHQVKTTTDMVGQGLGIPNDKIEFSFQSRLGADQWLEPYTAPLLKELPKKGIKKLVIACPAFTADCLETLEEIHEEGEEIFMEAGGESFKVVPCLNSDDPWIETMDKLIKEIL